MWEVLRELAPTDLSLASKTDAELEQMALERANTDIAQYRADKKGLPQMVTFHRIWGHHRSRKAQVAIHLEAYREQRKNQKAILRKANALRRFNQKD
jgi:hypothetical protein